MYLVAGQLIPALTGMDWDTFVQQRLFKPLGMADSVTSITAFKPNENVVTPHITVDGQAQMVAHRNYDNVGPAASIYSSVVDMAQYLRLHLRQGRYADQQLLSAAIAQELTTPQMVIPIRPNPPALAALTPEFYTYGLGWFIRNYRGRKVVTHSGGVDGLVALATMVPEEDLGIVVLANQESALAAAVVYSLLDAYLGAPATDWYAAFLASAVVKLSRKSRPPKPHIEDGPRERHAAIVDTGAIRRNLSRRRLRRSQCDAGRRSPRAALQSHAVIYRRSGTLALRDVSHSLARSDGHHRPS